MLHMASCTIVHTSDVEPKASMAVVLTRMRKQNSLQQRQQELDMIMI